jgi:hypothetical protein
VGHTAAGVFLALLRLRAVANAGTALGAIAVAWLLDVETAKGVRFGVRFAFLVLVLFLGLGDAGSRAMLKPSPALAKPCRMPRRDGMLVNERVKASKQFWSTVCSLSLHRSLRRSDVLRTGRPSSASAGPGILSSQGTSPD